MMLSNEELLEAVRHMVKERFAGDASGHDYWHLVRVERLAKRLAEAEGADVFVCRLAALVHDMIDEKLVPDTEQALSDLVAYLRELGLTEFLIDQVVAIIPRFLLVVVKNKSCYL